jgi:hypothetical protein
MVPATQPTVEHTWSRAIREVLWWGGVEAARKVYVPSSEVV